MSMVFNMIAKAAAGGSKTVYSGNASINTYIEEIDVGVSLKEDDVFLAYIPSASVTSVFLIVRISYGTCITLYGEYNDYYGDNFLGASLGNVTYEGTIVRFGTAMYPSVLGGTCVWYLIQ